MNKLSKISSPRALIRRLIYGYRASSDTYIKYLKKIGVNIGLGCHIYTPNQTFIDIENPHLLKLGNNVLMTGPVAILTHDYAWSVLKAIDGSILGNQKPVTIGSNVFIGWGAVILGGVTIGDNVIIGANGIVNKDCEPNSVYAGNPAEKIMSIKEYSKRRVEAQRSEATILAQTFAKRYSKQPPIDLFDSYFSIFTQHNDQLMMEHFKKRMQLMNNYEDSKRWLEKENKPQFENYADFLKSCEIDFDN